MTPRPDPAQSDVRRRVLCVFPRYTPSFGTFEAAYPFVGVKAFMPPQGILVIANYLPAVGRAFRRRERAARRTRRISRGPTSCSSAACTSSAADLGHQPARSRVRQKSRSSAAPRYPVVPNIIRNSITCTSANSATRPTRSSRGSTRARAPAAQVRFETKERVPLAEFPVPAYDKIDVAQYFLGSVQFSSGCPYRCEFCDIPELYGNNPRLKTPEQIVAELDAMLANGGERAVYFVDDNFVGNRKAGKELLPHLIAWQKKNGYPFSSRARRRSTSRSARLARDDARGVLLHDLLRHRDARSRGAQSDAQGPEQHDADHGSDRR